ncbi:MAG: ribose 5-phosphate isomerase A, partial [Nitrososphaeria archaeon]|nr:ribose 5-phosphate isomerase A [Nitrososphaeria archaeon]
MDWRDEAKKRAAVEAVKHVRDGFVLGLGSGTTAAFAIKEIGRLIQEESIRVLGVPTSYQA